MFTRGAFKRREVVVRFSSPFSVVLVSHSHKLGRGVTISPVPTEAELARQENRDYESADQLLQRILTERRAKWNGHGKYSEPAPPSTPSLPELPEGWVWATVEQITENFDGRRIPLKSADRDKRSGQYPYYGASGIIDDIDEFLFDGDFLLIAEDGANLLSRSTPIAFKASGRFWVNNYAHVVQTRDEIPLMY